MQSQSYVTFQTRLCVILVLVASLMWVAVSAFILYNPLIPDFVDLSRVSGTVTLCTQLCSLLSLLVFVTGEVTANVSSVDRLWSLVPSLYTGLTWARHGGSRLALMTLVSSVWSLRLTWNFWRRGGYSWPPWTGCEDYRWEYVRKWPVLNTKVGWSLFNLTFISFYQNFLLMGIASPAWIVAATLNADINVLDFMAAITFLALIFVETVADNQQEEFQNSKKQLAAESRSQAPFSTGFITWGLFSISRHPNYLAEQTLWVVFYIFSVAATGSLLNASLTGSVLLILLFQGSTALSESITSGKYRGYSEEYCTKVPRFIGNFWSLNSHYLAAVTDKRK